MRKILVILFFAFLLIVFTKGTAFAQFPPQDTTWSPEQPPPAPVPADTSGCGGNQDCINTVDQLAQAVKQQLPQQTLMDLLL